MKKDSLFQTVTTVSRVHVRVFDLSRNTYTCDTSFTYSSKWAWLGSHFDKLYADVDTKEFASYFAKAG